MKNLLYFTAMLFFASCVSHKQVTYFNDIQDLQSGALNIPNAPKPILKSGDFVEIQISSASLETNAYFEKDQSSSDQGFGGNMYQINAKGLIFLPLVGEVEIAGKTKEQARQTIEV
ncbi:MAG: polysaccharide biosynthesis/export family protein, partial [Bacteroidota bacterium]